jgi:hypothetical protein
MEDEVITKMGVFSICDILLECVHRKDHIQVAVKLPSVAPYFRN